ncbi:unnamed protein product [marine sediment metagenome]|uniref:Uncharacterized protein n=1 Tax=marine sediment metagenome TaxID=412755 RepID=X0RPN7_9ZZZZ
MSIVEELSALVQCGSYYDCETLKKLLLVDQECVSNISLCEALQSAIKLDADGNIFLDIPISLRVNEVHTKGENPIVLEDTVWEDLRFPATGVRVGGAQPATEQAYRGGIVLSFASNADNSMYFTAQMPHSWKEFSEMEVHIHWTIPTSGAGGGAENVKWDLTYSIANQGGSFPVETPATVTVDVQDITANDHIYTDIVDIDMAGMTISNCIIFSLTRDVSVANDYAQAAYIVEADIHYQRDSMGSKEEQVK